MDEYTHPQDKVSSWEDYFDLSPVEEACAVWEAFQNIATDYIVLGNVSLEDIRIYALEWHKYSPKLQVEAIALSKSRKELEQPI